MKKTEPRNFVKIQNKWMECDIIHVYDNGDVWYNLKNGQGAGWVEKKYKQKYRIV